MNTFFFLSVPFVSTSLTSMVQKVATLMSKKGHHYICVTGLHGLLEVQKHAHYVAAFTKATYIVPDGMPIVFLGRLSGHTGMQRIYGPDFMKAICAMAAKKNKRVFFYGSTLKTLVSLKKTIRRHYPTLSIVGIYSPPFGQISEKKKKEISQYINHTKPDIIFVGLSTPKQEQWMYEQSDVLSASVLIGVGAAFDFLSGVKPQAPVWMQHASLEWLFRWMHEPLRLTGRYMEIMVFLPFYVLLYFFRQKGRQSSV